MPFSPFSQLRFFRRFFGTQKNKNVVIDGESYPDPESLYGPIQSPTSSEVMGSLRTAQADQAQDKNQPGGEEEPGQDAGAQPEPFKDRLDRHRAESPQATGAPATSSGADAGGGGGSTDAVLEEIKNMRLEMQQMVMVQRETLDVLQNELNVRVTL